MRSRLLPRLSILSMCFWVSACARDGTSTDHRFTLKVSAGISIATTAGFRSVSAVQPIFSAIERIAAHCDLLMTPNLASGWSLRQTRGDPCCEIGDSSVRGGGAPMWYLDNIRNLEMSRCDSG